MLKRLPINVSDFTELRTGYRETEESVMLKRRYSDHFIFQYRELIRKSSLLDLEDEESIHMQLMGLSMWFANEYTCITNVRNENGVCSFILKATSVNNPNFIVELKRVSKFELHMDPYFLHKIAQVAMRQIGSKGYANHLHGDTVYIGIGQCGKKIEIEMMRKGENYVN